MFKVTVGRKEYLFKFSHNVVWGNKTRTTHCFVNGTIFGVAYCNPKDNFTKSTGRKLSLQRAIVALGFKRDERKLIWDAYFAKVATK